MIRIKICGITNLEDALAACDMGADALGFNLAPEAQAKNRYLEPEKAYMIIEKLPPFVTTVAVTVNESRDRLMEYLKHVDCVQLHGEELPENLPPAHRVIKVFRVGGDFRISDLSAYPIRAWLLDAHARHARGGTGQVFDWEVAREAVALGRPVILAGGLNPDNIALAVKRVGPYAVDVSGGVEREPGKKDHALLREFIQNAREAFMA